MAQTFWASKDSQPKRKHRFAVSFGSTGLPEWIASRVTRPSMEVSTVEHQYLNHTFKFPGRAKWQNISVTLRDPLQPDASENLYRILDKAGYRAPNKDPGDKSQKQSFTKAKFQAAIGTLKIQTLNAEGSVVETWTLFNPIITNVNWGEFDYSSEDLLDLTLDIAYDYATIETNKA